MFFEYYRKKSVGYLYCFYCMLGLATLTKGFVTLILVGATIVLFLLTEKRLYFIKEIKLARGIMIYLAIILPWLVTISIKEKEFFYFFVIDQHFLRFLTAKHKRTGSLFYFFPVVFGGMFPWSFLIPRSFVKMWQYSEVRFFLIWSILVFIFFSISKSKLPPYILPIFPAMSVVIGCYFSEIFEQHGKKYIEQFLYLFLFLLFAIVSLFGINRFFNQLAWVIPLESFYVFQELKPFFFATGIITLCVAFFILYFCIKDSSFRVEGIPPIFLILFLFSFSFLFSTFFVFDKIDKINTSKELGMIVKQTKQKYDKIINYGSFNESLPFYTGERIIIASYKGELDMGSKYKDAMPYFIDEGTFLNHLKGESRVWVVLKAKRIERLRDFLGERMRIVSCKNQNCLLTN